MKLSHHATRYVAFFRKHGLAIGIALAAHRLLSKLGGQSGLYWYKFYEQPLQDVHAAPRVGSNLEFKWLEKYHELLARLPRPLPNIQNRFAQNVQCLAAIKHDQLVACAWFGFEEFEEDEVRCTYVLPTNAVWDFDIYVFPEYRISRVFLRTWQEANRMLSGRGYAYTLSRISVYNKHSIRSHEKLGAQMLGSALFLRVGAAQLMLASQRPYFSLTLSKKRSPQIDFLKESAGWR